MDRSILPKIIRLLDEMTSLINSSQHISAIEMELMKKKCISLYDCIIQLRPETENPDRPSAVEVKPLLAEQEEITTEKNITEPVAIINESHKTPEDKEPRITLFDEPADLPKEEMSMHEKLSSSLGDLSDMNERFQSKIESLKSAISLNRKIAYVNVLFNENTVEYAKAIDKLNSATTLDEAMRYFNEMKHVYNWENDHELVTDLRLLIEKRFA